MSDPATAAGALRDAAALIYVEDLDVEPLELGDAHHLLHVLRLRAGETIVAADGDGSFRFCRLVAPPRSHPDGRRRPAALLLEPFSERHREEPAQPPLTVAFGIQKGDRAEWTVQKLTELGIDHIVPLFTERTVVRLSDSERQRRGERLRKIAREAGAQSRRPRLPDVSDPLEFTVFANGLTPSARLAEPGASGSLGDCDTILIGPEGGWSPTELGSGLGQVCLGHTILRAETAAVAAGALLAAVRAGVVKTS